MGKLTERTERIIDQGNYAEAEFPQGPKYQAVVRLDYGDAQAALSSELIRGGELQEQVGQLLLLKADGSEPTSQENVTSPGTGDQPLIRVGSNHPRTITQDLPQMAKVKKIALIKPSDPELPLAEASDSGGGDDDGDNGGNDGSQQKEEESQRGTSLIQIAVVLSVVYIGYQIFAK